MVKIVGVYKLKVIKYNEKHTGGTPSGKGASSPRRASIAMPGNIFIKKFLTIGFFHTAMHS